MKIDLRIRVRRSSLLVASVGAVVLIASACSKERKQPLIVGIAPYQDLAMLVTAKSMGFDTSQGVSLELRTLAWEQILPAVASAGNAAEIGFGSLAEYLAKEHALNANTQDSLLFIYPLYVYRGGGFVTFRPQVPRLDSASLRDSVIVRKFLSYAIGAQKNSIYEMIISELGSRVGIRSSQIRMLDVPLNEGMLGANSKSLDITSVGLTQLAEARKRGGRAVLVMDDLGVADVTGFICRKSVLEARGSEVDALIRAWFQAVDYVLRDLDRNSGHSLAYLQANAATKYTLDEYKQALSAEYFPRSLAEADREFLSDSGRYNVKRISSQMAQFLFREGRVGTLPLMPLMRRVSGAPVR